MTRDIDEETVRRMLDALERTARAMRRRDDIRAVDLFVDHLKAMRAALMLGPNRLAEYLNHLESGVKEVS